MIVPANADHSFQEPAFFSANGRRGRLRWIACVTLAQLAASAVAIVLTSLFKEESMVGTVLVLGVVVAFLWYYLLITIQRSHDNGWSGWTSIFALVPVVSLIWMFVPGNKEANAYGQPPVSNPFWVVFVSLIFPLVAIAGIVAAISLPAYSQYTKRAEIFQQNMERQRQQQRLAPKKPSSEPAPRVPEVRTGI